MDKPELLTVEVVYEIQTLSGDIQERHRRFQMTPKAFEEMHTAEIRAKYLPAWGLVTGAIWRIEHLMDSELKIKRYVRVQKVGSRGKRPPCRWYTVYDRKTDKLLAAGTVEQCTAALGFKNSASFYQTLSRTRNGKSHKYRICVEDRLAELEEDVRDE